MTARCGRTHQAPAAQGRWQQRVRGLRHAPLGAVTRMVAAVAGGVAPLPLVPGAAARTVAATAMAGGVAPLPLAEAGVEEVAPLLPRTFHRRPRQRPG